MKQKYATKCLSPFLIFISGLAWGQSIGTLPLAQQNACNACHLENGKSLGPDWASIRKKYSQLDVAYLSQKVLKGGAGVWGGMPMPGSSKLSQSEAEALVVAIGLPTNGTAQEQMLAQQRVQAEQARVERQEQQAKDAKVLANIKSALDVVTAVTQAKNQVLNNGRPAASYSGSSLAMPQSMASMSQRVKPFDTAMSASEQAQTIATWFTLFTFKNTLAMNEDRQLKDPELKGRVLDDAELLSIMVPTKDVNRCLSMTNFGPKPATRFDKHAGVRWKITNTCSQPLVLFQCVTKLNEQFCTRKGVDDIRAESPAFYLFTDEDPGGGSYTLEDDSDGTMHYLACQGGGDRRRVLGGWGPKGPQGSIFAGGPDPSKSLKANCFTYAGDDRVHQILGVKP